VDGRRLATVHARLWAPFTSGRARSHARLPSRKLDFPSPISCSAARTARATTLGEGGDARFGGFCMRAATTLDSERGRRRLWAVWRKLLGFGFIHNGSVG
jgi:hypothetical protein